MVVELGQIALILAFVVAIVQAIVPLVGAHRGWADWCAVAVPAAIVQFLLTLLAFLALMHAFVVSDFSVRLVALNSHSAKPLLYKIAGTWGNHEGSMMLWMLILTLFGAMVGLWGANLPQALRARVLGVQATIAVAFFAFILFTSNPFVRLAEPPFDGNDLNPLLQDPGLAFHPPFLYTGYVGLSMAYSFAIAALIEGRVDAAWARWVRPWTLLAWIFLTIGIAFGSIWAYYELGWGGWWFWDPVENVSFMPWLVSCALLHSAIVVEKRDTLKSWTILLAILAFSFSLIGAFIVRSGILTSVHAFANDPERGFFLLLILGAFIGGSLTLYAWRATSLRSGTVFAPVSRESGLVLNNLLLVAAAGVVFVGTLWPLVIDVATGAKVSVGAPFFNTAFTPFMILLAIALPVGAVLPWKRGRLGRAVRQLRGAAALAFAFAALAYVVGAGGSMTAPIGAGLGAWLVFGAIADVGQRVRVGDLGLAAGVRRLAHLPRADWGRALAHAGLGVTIFGIAAMSAWATEDIRSVREGESFSVGAYTLTFRGLGTTEGANYSAETATIVVTRGGQPVATLHPEKRLYPIQGTTTTEAAISRGFTRDLYVALGDPQPDGGRALRTYVKPFSNWIWGGAMLMALGGVASLTDRRYRVGAPAPRRGALPVAAE